MKMNERKNRPLLTVREMAYRYERLLKSNFRYKKIIGGFDEFMCNNEVDETVHSLWNELFRKYPVTERERYLF